MNDLIQVNVGLFGSGKNLSAEGVIMRLIPLSIAVTMVVAPALGGDFIRQGHAQNYTSMDEQSADDPADLTPVKGAYIFDIRIRKINDAGTPIICNASIYFDSYQFQKSLQATEVKSNEFRCRIRLDVDTVSSKQSKPQYDIVVTSRPKSPWPNDVFISNRGAFGVVDYPSPLKPEIINQLMYL